MKKALFVPVIVLLFLFMLSTAFAGDYLYMIVATEGEGIPVYNSPESKKQIGVLYNGYEDVLSLKPARKRHSCSLTEDAEVWLDMEKSMENISDEAVEYPKQYKDQIPSNCFLAEVVADRAKVYSNIAHKHVLAEHSRGTLVMVYGSFGSDYYIWCCGRGFIPKSDVQKVKDLTFFETHCGNYGYTDLQTAEVYAGNNHIFLSYSTTGISEEKSMKAFKSGNSLTVLRDLGAWAQVVITDEYKSTPMNGFVEKRFLDSEGDHSVQTAVVKTEHPLNRLIVREKPDRNAYYIVKLCSGMRVQVLSSANGWTWICWENDKAEQLGVYDFGFVMSKYLVTGAAEEQVENACTRVRFCRDLINKSKSEVVLPAGQEATVIGVIADYDKANTFILRLDDGQTYYVEDNQPEPLLEPVDAQTYKAKTTKRTAFYTGPSSKSEKIRTLNSGAAIEVLLRGEQWALIRYKGETGYIPGNALKGVK